jgi:iron-sulfur cluster assembly protein
MAEIVTITESAKAKVISSMEEPGDNLRLAVKGGGCSGMSYELFGEAPEDVQEIDTVIPHEGFNIVIDQKSIIYLKGMELDFDEGLQGKGFVFKNPLATSTCGCGESFSVT